MKLSTLLKPIFHPFIDEKWQPFIQSRLYGGIRYRTGIEKGFDQGCDVAASILERIKLR